MAKRSKAIDSVIKAATLAHERVEAVLAVESSLADELFGREQSRAYAYDSAKRSILALHDLTRKVWSRASSPQEEVAWLMKDQAETMRNIVEMSHVIRADFLEKIDRIKAGAEIIERKKMTKMTRSR
jgi:hypothetical protein